MRRRDSTAAEQLLETFGDRVHRLDDGHPHGDSSGDWSAKIDDPAIQSELRHVLTSAIDELPANHRAVLVLHDVEGLSM